MKKLLGIVVLGLLMSGNAYSAIKIKNWLEGKSGSDIYIKRINDKLVFSAYSGLLTINTQLDKPFFCQPDELSVNEQMTEAILDAGIERFKETGMAQIQLNDLPVGVVLLEQLKLMFPCE